MKPTARRAGRVLAVNVGGSLLSSVLKILVTAATLALVYFLVIKPVLNTTESITNSTNDSIQKSMESVNDAFDTSNNGSVTIQRQITKNLKTEQPGQQSPVIKCINRAQQDVNKIERCAKKYGLIPQ